MALEVPEAAGKMPEKAFSKADGYPPPPENQAPGGEDEEYVEVWKAETPRRIGVAQGGDFEKSESDGCGGSPERADRIGEDFADIEIERKAAASGEPQDPVQNPPRENRAAEESAAASPRITGGDSQIIRPDEHLPRPEAPPGLRSEESAERIQRSRSSPGAFSSPEPFPVDVPAIGKFIRDRSNSLSAAIARRISTMKEGNGGSSPSGVTEFDLPGLKVIVKQKEDDGYSSRELNLRGRISFFSRSNCRDCTAVRAFLRETGLRFVEINIDVFPQRERELVDRTGSAAVPQIFFNEKLFGGLVALNSLRNSGLLEQRLRELLGRRCAGGAPEPPMYGFDDPEEERTDEMIGIVRVLRQRLPIQDRLMRMKIVRNCFAGTEMVEVMIHHLHCGRRKVVDMGKVLARKHFIHHVFGENDFEDGNHFYRFIEHEPFIPKCFNFRGSTNDYEPKNASAVAQKLSKIMAAILESYSSDDRCHVDYRGISKSEEFRRYVNLTQELHRTNIMALSKDEKLAFFLNLHNAMAIHAIIRGGRPDGVIDRRSFFSDFQYLVGGHPYSLSTIKNGILRSNRRPPYSLVRPFGNGDKRLELVLPKLNPLIHFGLCEGTRSSPTVRFFSPQGIEAELRYATREFFQRGGVEIDLAKRTVYLTRILKWFNMDFGMEKGILKWVVNFLDATKSGLLMHLLGDGGPVNIVYQNYDWSVNS